MGHSGWGVRGGAGGPPLIRLLLISRKGHPPWAQGHRDTGAGLSGWRGWPGASPCSDLEHAGRLSLAAWVAAPFPAAPGLPAGLAGCPLSAGSGPGLASAWRPPLHEGTVPRIKVHFRA